MKIAAVCIGTARQAPGKRTKTGIFKHPVTGAAMLDDQGLVGDAVCNRKHHGGPDQAVLVLGSIDLDWWSAELGTPLDAGTFGENLVIEGLDSRAVCVGDRLATPGALLEATAARIPCGTLAARMGDPDFPKRFMRTGRPGFYCRVLRGGFVQAGDPVDYHRFPGAPVTMMELLSTFGRPLAPQDRRRYLDAPLAGRIRRMLID